jgi:hypothetical protein
MKKSIIFIAIFLIFPLVSAVDFEINSEFDQGETLLAKISGNFLEPVTEDNVFFYRGHVGIPVVYDIVEMDDEFYLYALLTGKDSGNYSVALENVRYMKGAEVSEEDIVKEFTITEDTAFFSVNPGFVETFEDFSIEIQNLQESKITVEITAGLDNIVGNSTELKSGEIKDIEFDLIEDSPPTTETVIFTSGNLTYEIPVFITTNTTREDEKDREFKFEPSVLDVSMATNSDAKRIIYLRNTGEADLEDIFISMSPLLEPYISLSIDEIDDLEANTSEKIELFLLSDLEEVIIEGEITATTENLTISSTLILNFIADFIPIDEEAEVEVRSTLTCSEEGGTICAENEECSEDIIYTKDDVCCLATCEEIKTSSTGKIIGWLIIIVIILVLFWFFKTKYFGVKRKVNLSRIGKGKR